MKSMHADLAAYEMIENQTDDGHPFAARGNRAERSGVSRAHLLRLRRGEMDPTRRIMIALAEAASAMRAQNGLRR